MSHRRNEEILGRLKEVKFNHKMLSDKNKSLLRDYKNYGAEGQSSADILGQILDITSDTNKNSNIIKIVSCELADRLADMEHALSRMAKQIDAISEKLGLYTDFQPESDEVSLSDEVPDIDAFTKKGN